MDEKDVEQAAEKVYSILVENEGLTKREIVNKWQEPPVRPSEKFILTGNALLELMHKWKVFFVREKPSKKTLGFDETPYHYFTNNTKSEHEL